MTSPEPGTSGLSFWSKLTGALVDGAVRLVRIGGWQRYLTAFGFGVLTATALAPYYFLPGILLGLSGLVFLIDSTREAQNPKRAAFLTGWAFGFGYFLFSMYWLAFAFLVQADQFAWMIPIAVPAFTGFLGLFFAGATWAASFVWQGHWPRLLYLTVAIALFEFARGHVLTGLPWNLIGQSFAGTAILAQLAAYVGPYGLSVIVTLLGMMLAASVRVPERQFFPWPLVGFVGGMAVILLIGAIRLSPTIEMRDDIKVAIAQPNIPQRDKIDPQKSLEHFRRTVRITNEALPQLGTAYAVWPENTYPFLAQAPDAPGYFGDALPPQAILISGTIRSYEQDDQTHYGNTAVVFGQNVGPEKPVAAIYDKHHLVPFGEYLPLKGVLKALGLSQLNPMGDGFTPGPGPRTIKVGPTSFAPLICFEDVFPRQLYPRDNRPDWLVTVTNDAWFGDGAGPRQHVDIARLRTIESGLPMARSANTGISAMIDPKGRVLDSIPLYEAGVILAALPAPVARPLYDRLGEVGFFLLIAILAAIPRASGLAYRV